MARTLSELQKQYHSSAKPGKPMGGPGGGPRGRGPQGPGGKPKNMKKTVGRLLSYVGKYRILLVLVLVFILI